LCYTSLYRRPLHSLPTRRSSDLVPIIPGLRPIPTLSQIVNLPSTFFLDFPDDLMDELEKCKDNAAVKEVGIQWAIQQSKELIAAGIPCIHYYTMSKADATYKTAKEVF